jgi:hypothetical protein
VFELPGEDRLRLGMGILFDFAGDSKKYRRTIKKKFFFFEITSLF